MVPNPGKLAAQQQVADAEQAIAEAQAHYDRAEDAGMPATARADHDAFAAAPTELADRIAHAGATPARAPISEVRPASRRLNDDNESASTTGAHGHLQRRICPGPPAGHPLPRADDEARTLLREIFAAPADLHIRDGQLHVRLHPLSVQRRTRAFAALCVDLTATQTVYPGTDLILVYTVKDH